MAHKSIFNTDIAAVSSPTEPEELFRYLRGRDPEIKHLWSHQADLLRDYHKKHCNTRDVAIELPTGSGKTLVGLLIAEWRRQALQERVAYLCPTRQLAEQVGKQAYKYGIQAHVLTGKQEEYPPKEFSDFRLSQAIAITTYSSIFNVNPAIKAQTLILDDAHAGENFIANMWSVEISREECQEAYTALVHLLQDAMSEECFNDITELSSDSYNNKMLIEMIPSFFVRKYKNGIRDLLQQKLAIRTSPWYSWNVVKNHLASCNIFISYNLILIRPYIPPTLTHAPFEQANQRVYMSATLGAGGELERITGIRSIERLPFPKGYDKQSSGRRLFLVPELTVSRDIAIEVIVKALQSDDSFPRSVILTPTLRHGYRDDSLCQAIEKTNINIIQAIDIENNLAPFLDCIKTSLLLARYDGLDLPGDACRLLIIDGLPSGTNLQEKFLWSKIQASSLLRDRVVTRFTQGVGRCTRSDNDFAVIFILGRDLIEFLTKNENRRILHPELQAELEFGLKNSEDVNKFELLWDVFLLQGEEWQTADQAIVSLRDQYSYPTDPISQKLNDVVASEVAYLYAMWQGEFEDALRYARQVADTLGGDATKSYRAWWYYLAAETATSLHETTCDETYSVTAFDLLKRASQCCVGISWFTRVRRSVFQSSGIALTEMEMDEISAIAVETIRELLAKWGSVGPKFERKISQIDRNIQSVEHEKFHKGLEALGTMLGFKAKLPSGPAVPDCIWSIESIFYVAHEAKSEQRPDSFIGVENIRQAAGHYQWLRANCSFDGNTHAVCLIESPRTVVDQAAIAHAQHLYHVTPKQLKALFDESAAILRQVRSKSVDLNDEQIVEELFRLLSQKDLVPTKIMERLSQMPVQQMKKYERR